MKQKKKKHLSTLEVSLIDDSKVPPLAIIKFITEFLDIKSLPLLGLDLC